jgi:hypothetical protein
MGFETQGFRATGLLSRQLPLESLAHKFVFIFIHLKTFSALCDDFSDPLLFRNMFISHSCEFP